MKKRGTGVFLLSSYGSTQRFHISTSLLTMSALQDHSGRYNSPSCPPCHPCQLVPLSPLPSTTALTSTPRYARQIFTLITMSDSSNEHTPQPYALVNISNNAGFGGSESTNEAFRRNLTFPGTFQVLFGLTTVDPLPPPLSCPVSNCSSVFAGRTPQRYLSRHLKYPGIWGRTGEEKVAWINLHKIEHHRLIVTRSISSLFHRLHLRGTSDGANPANILGAAKSAKPKLRAKKLAQQRTLRAAAFMMRANEMGITDTALIAEKLAIWEGIWGDKEKGDSIGVSILFLSLKIGVKSLLTEGQINQSMMLGFSWILLPISEPSSTPIHSMCSVP